jgi:hypothetical protein
MAEGLVFLSDFMYFVALAIFSGALTRLSIELRRVGA